MTLVKLIICKKDCLRFLKRPEGNIFVELFDFKKRIR